MHVHLLQLGFARAYILAAGKKSQLLAHQVKQWNYMSNADTNGVGVVCVCVHVYVCVCGGGGVI